MDKINPAVMAFIRAHLEHCAKACSYSMRGFITAFKDEIAFRQILLILCAAICLAFWLGDSWAEITLLILPPCLSAIVELLNTAIENAVDLAQPEWHPLAKKAKDTASAAQFFSQILSGAVWLSFLADKFIFS